MNDEKNLNYQTNKRKISEITNKLKKEKVIKKIKSNSQQNNKCKST